MEYSGHNSACMLARLASSIMVLMLLSATVLGGISRTVGSDAGGRLVIKLTWSFESSPSSCLIVEERLPPGWMPEPLQHEGYAVPWWQQGNCLHLAFGVAVLPGAAGTITYYLVPSPNMQDSTVVFAGTAATMQGLRLVNLPIGGDSVYELPSTEPLRMLARLTGMTLSSDGGGSLVNLNFKLMEAGDGSGTGDMRAAVGQDPVLYVDFRATLEPSDAWQCIYTSVPSLRISNPDVVAFPDRAGPGFYRLRMDTD